MALAHDCASIGVAASRTFEALICLNGLFDTIYAETSRSSIAPEKLLRAMLIQVFFSVRSERPLMEQRLLRGVESVDSNFCMGSLWKALHSDPYA